MVEDQRKDGERQFLSALMVPRGAEPKLLALDLLLIKNRLSRGDLLVHAARRSLSP